MMAEITYTKNGDYLIPDIQMETAETKPLNKYGRMRRTYLKEGRPVLYSDLVLTEKLFPHLWEIQETAARRVEQITAELLLTDPAPDKKTDQLGWAAHMNSLKAQAEEIVTAELITA